MISGTLSHLRSAWRAPPLLAKRVLAVNGHPDPAPGRYCAALCAAYAEGAQARGFKTQRIDVGAAIPPCTELRNPSVDIVERLWLADRVFIAFPMWLGGPPPALKSVLEEFTRWQDSEAEQLGEPPHLKMAVIVMTASYPGLLYRTGSGAPLGDWSTALSSLDVARTILIGSVESISQEERNRWVTEVRRLGSSLSGCDPERADPRCSR